MRIKIFVLLTVAAMAAGTARAQDGLSREVDVTKDYTPLVGRATKLPIAPQMGDTTTLRPDFDYMVEPRAWMSRFGVEPIRAARLDVGGVLRQRPLYLKAGGGYPGQTLLDLRLTTPGTGATGAGLYVNHRAQLSRLKNLMGDKVDAKSTVNSAGVFGRVEMGRWSVAGDLGADYDVWTEYFATGRMQHYLTPRASIVAGNDFTDLSRLNVRVGADGYLFSDRYDHKENGVDAFAEAARRFGLHEFGLRGEVKAFGYDRDVEHSRSATSSRILSVTPRYGFAGEWFGLMLGVQLAHEKSEGSSTRGMPGAAGGSMWRNRKKFRFLPEAELKVTIGGGALCSYVRLDGELRENTLRSMTTALPILSPEYDWLAPQGATAEQRLHAGVAGHVGAAVSYDLFVGGERLKNVGVYASNFVADGAVRSKDFGFLFMEKAEAFVAGAGMEVAAGGFAASLAAKYASYKGTDYWPGLRGSLGLSYSHGDRWAVRAGADYRGAYYMISGSMAPIPDGVIFIIVDRKVPQAVDLSLGVDCRISDRLGVFVEGHNLAGQELFPWPPYRGLGASVSAGVKVRM